ncbi:DUF4129 domain-containing protein [Halogeometricum borinquense]|uniref:DUF4129 domain-containing protein n=1 Tax=Halogeometricum borinquense TaxID=60847 RepID=A0A482TBM9_9EURY|nr:DUF4129 domain-containing protein [Halogeometricum borinquense]RYJ14297.1 DUF4129 domain-containing protein [Halogeometricum borinquense]
MKQRFTGFHDRLLSALAIGLCMLLVAIVAATLNSSLSTTTAPDPPKSTPGSGVSLIALFYQLINAVLAIFGISLNPRSGQFFGGSTLGLIFRLLQAIYQHRLAIITAVVLLVVLGLLYQYHHRLAVPRILQSSSETTNASTPSSTTDTASTSWPPRPDPDSVQDAWVAMVRRVDDDVETPSSQTPTEWQEIAIASGLPSDAVETITSMFCAIQYGNVTETETNRKRVQAALDAHQEDTNE